MSEKIEYTSVTLNWNRKGQYYVITANHKKIVPGFKGVWEGSSSGRKVFVLNEKFLVLTQPFSETPQHVFKNEQELIEYIKKNYGVLPEIVN